MDSQAMEMNEKANGSAPDQARGFDPLPFLSRLLRRRASRQEVDPPPSRATTRPELEDADEIIDLAASTPAEEEEVEPEDPACVAAGLLIDHALRAAGTTLADASRDGAVTLVVVPAEPWISHAAERWKIEARHGDRPRDGFRELHWTDRGTYSRRSDWMCWKAEAPRETGASKCDDESFAKAVADGRHCAAFTADLAWLPADLVAGADHFLSMPPLSSDDVTEVARRLCGTEPTARFSDDEAARITPRLLRLSRRPGQTADAYVGKLRTLLSRDLRVEADTDKEKRVMSVSLRNGPALERLHGADEAVAFGQGLKQSLALYKAGKIAWVDVDPGLLISGPPGCGKTTFARALAAGCEVPLITGSYGDWHSSGSSHQGDLLKAMKRTFDKARESAPCILFIDEVDSFPNRSTLPHAWRDWEIQVVNALLSHIDGVEGRDGVFLLAACNHPELLDPALIRSGRLDRHIRFRLPDRLALAAILREHIGPDLPRADLSGAALAATGSSGADCERFVRGARRRARDAGRDLSLGDLLAEIGGQDGRSPADLWRAAVHEAGHAVACCTMAPGSLQVVSLRVGAGAGGSTFAVRSSRLLLAEDIRQTLIIRLSGRAAEEAILGSPSSGSGGDWESDLAAATELATAAATTMGLDEESGLIWRGVPDMAVLPEMLRTDPALAARVRSVIAAAYADALGLARRRASAVKALAAELLRCQVIDGAAAASIVQQHSGSQADLSERAAASVCGLSEMPR
jgi:cell division protease FtsH